MKNGGGPICYLCGLQSDNLPSLGGKKDFRGVSCRRCGDYYLDGLLATCGITQEEAEKVILSGYTRWEKALGHVAPALDDNKIKTIICENRQYSDEMKIDKLLKYYSKKYPDKGSNIEYVSDIDYPITFSKNSNEFIYLLEKVAYETLNYIENLSITSGGPPEGYFKITPRGWERINWINKIDLADEKYELEKQETLSILTREAGQMKEQAHINGTKWSTGLVRRIGDLYLKNTLTMLAKGLQIDKEILFEGKEDLSRHEIEVLCARTKILADSERACLKNMLSETCRDCRIDEGYFKTVIDTYLLEIERKSNRPEGQSSTGLPVGE